jgi:hypothetical protein
MRRAALVVVVLAALAAGGWYAVWRHVAGNVEAAVLAWIAQQREEGVEVRYARMDVAGFPLGWEVVFDEASIARREPTLREWRARRLEASLRPWRLGEIALRFPGPQRVTRDTPWRAAETVEFEAARPEGWLRLEHGRAVELRLDLGELRARRLPDDQVATASRLRFLGARVEPPDARTGESLRATLDVDDLVLPVAPPGFTAPVRSASLEAALRGVLDADRRPRDAIAAWRDAGGTLEIRRLALDWPPLALAGDGTIALDPQNRPLGAFALRVAGYAETLDAIAASGTLRPREAAAIKAALNLLARQDGEGRREVRLPLSMQDGKLSIAGFAIRNLDPLPFE